MTSRHTLRTLTLLACLALPSIAAADVIPMDVTACDMRSVGASCMDAMGTGICQASRCTRLDYTQDASPGPGSVQYDCVRCVVGAPSDAGSADAGATPARPTSSCSVGHGAEGAWWIGALGLAAFLARRRR